MMRTSSAFSRAIASGGVLAGATTAIHTPASKPGKPDSATVGTSGRCAERVAPVCAITFSLPAFTCGRIAVGLSESTCTSPATRAITAGAPPLYGMCSMRMPAMALSISIESCEMLPLPTEA